MIPYEVVSLRPELFNLRDGLVTLASTIEEALAWQLWRIDTELQEELNA